ncbi:immunoglobulin domain-containing protein [Cellulomonas sp. PhB150]|uniref:immunoglobulin domain-containing protein n=1 Tax=Cellulomonas sp. PhB150 TaxID=2485188 RepID=UPI000F94BC81|nr:immunoglobulin domain-containing protein [Cellulomonas sp. PhB150]ROS31203.1 hypothetical protein EDF34_0859 [Cellulomonas sp. PhB150]
MSARPMALRAGIAAVLGGALALGLVAPANAAPVTSAVVTHQAAAKAVTTKVTTAPRSLTVVAGKKATFKVGAKGTKLTYQWYVSKPGKKSFAKISGAKKSSYSVKTSSKVDGARYRVVVRGAKGTVTSKSARLVVVSKPKVTTNPRTVLVKTGSKATFTVKAAGHALHYQWQKSVDGGAWATVSGKTSASIVVSTRTAFDGTDYRVVVSNKAGKVASKVATLWVRSSVADPFAIGQYAELNEWALASFGTDDVTTDAVKAGAHTPATGTRYYALSTRVYYIGEGTGNAQSGLKVVLVGGDGKTYTEGDPALIDSDPVMIASGESKDLGAVALVPASALRGAVWKVTDTSNGFTEYLAVN